MGILNHLNPTTVGPMGQDDDREESAMAMRVFAGAVSSALVLFAHSAASASTVWPLMAGFGFLLVAVMAATSMSPATDH